MQLLTRKGSKRCHSLMRSSFGHPTLPNVIGSFFFIYSFIYFLLFFLESPENKFYLRIFLMTYDVTYMRCVCVSSLQASVGPGRGHMPLSAAHHHRGGHRLQSKCVCVCERQISTEPLMPLMHHVVVFFGIKCMKLGG